MGTAAREAVEGSEFRGITKSVTLERMRAFSGWPAKNVHTDEEFARRCGLPGPIASGVMSQAYLVELMLNLFGELWLSNERMQLTFLRIVQPGDRLTPKAVVRGRDEAESGVCLTLDVWCENQRGERVTVGFATGMVSEDYRPVGD